MLGEFEAAEDWFQRGVKEAIVKRKMKPTLNQDDGRYYLRIINFHSERKI